MTTNCGVKSNAEILSSLSALCIREGMNMKVSDANIGFLQVESTPSTMLGIRQTYVWQFNVKNGTVVGTAKALTETLNGFGMVIGSSEVGYNDKVHKDHKWYWNVRNSLESMCDGKLVFTEQN
ncbi:MAG: hypothetical protein H9535_19890 [Ignavibacteria bacterium]|nr:hypothetical protein [Ignavibacteria bacterium]